jgi:hypothetical protein
MDYTYQKLTESGSFGNPEGTEVKYAKNKATLRDAMYKWGRAHEQMGTTDEYAYIYVWKGALDDVTDQYPDFKVRFGPHDGIVFENC